MAQNKKTITIQLNEQFEEIIVDLGGGPITSEATIYNLYDNLPPGVYKGEVDLGRIYVYEQADRSLMICRHRLCRLV